MPPVLFAALLAAAQPAPPGGPATEVAPVVVTLPDPQRAARELSACLARGCPPAEDLRLTLRSADASFLAGDYRAARATLDASIRRNHRHARTHPVLLAGVYKADDTVNRHLGRGGEAHQSARQASILIARQYGPDSPEALWAQMDTADALLNDKRLGSARAAYQRVRQRAAAAGHRPTRAAAELRLAWIPALQGERDIARERLQRLIDGAGPDDGAQAVAAALMQIKLLSPSAQDAAATRLIDEVRKRSAGRPEPVLLWSPTLDRRQEAAAAATLAMAGAPAPTGPDISDWVDVGFAIDASGRVVEAEILRRGSKRGRWQEEVLDLVRRRVYAPATGAEPGERSYRVERLAYTALVQGPATGSRMSSRSILPQLHSLDLTRAAVEPEAR